MSAASGGTGYIAELLHLVGVPTATADHIQDLALRPLTILAVAGVTYLVANLGARLIRRTLNTVRVRVDHSSILQASRIDTVSRIVANSWRVAAFVIGSITALQVVGVNLTPFLAGATVIGATIGFGAQSLVRDFLSGFLMLLEDQYRIGDVVAVNDVSGTVEEVSLRVTEVRSGDGTTWYIPNGQILKLGNSSRHATKSVIEATVSIQTPINDARTVIETAAVHAIADPQFEGSVVRSPHLLGISAVTPATFTIELELETRPEVADPARRVLREAITEALARERMLPRVADPPAD